MEEYFVDRRGRFARDGFTPLEDFIVRYAKDNYSVDLRHFIEWSSNRSLYDSSVDYEATEVILLDCWSNVRSALFSGKIKSISVNGDGEEREVPEKFWGSDHADYVVRDGKIGYVKDITDGYCGRIIVDVSNGYLDNKHSRVISTDAIEAITNDESASYSYQPLGYMNICDAFDCILKAKTIIAKASGFIDGSYAVQKSKIDKIADALEHEMIDKFERGMLTAYHYYNDYTGNEKLRKINSRNFKSIVKDDSTGYGYGYQTVGVVASDKHRWKCEVSINVDGEFIEGIIVVGIEELSSVYSEDEIAAFNRSIENNRETSLINKDNKITNTKNNETIKNNRGRPSEFDKDLFMWEAIKVLVFEDGSFPTKEAHGLRASERYAAATGAKGPGDTWSGEQIKDLWKKLDVEGNLKKARRDSAKG